MSSNFILQYWRQDAKVLFVCDPPKQEYYRAGRIYSGKAYKCLFESLESSGIPKEDTKFISCCPPLPDTCIGSESRSNKHILNFHDEFISKVNAINPDFVVCLGKAALIQVTGKAVAHANKRGILQDPNTNKLNKFILPFYSPNNVLARPEIKDMFSADFKALARLYRTGFDGSKLSGENKVKYEWCTDLSYLVENPPKVLAVDTETTGLSWYKPDVKCLLVQLSYKEGHSLVVPVNRGYYPSLSEACILKLKNQLKSILENPSIAKTGHNFKYDYHILNSKLGISVKNWAIDTMQLAFAVDENMRSKSQNECVRRWVPEMAGYNDELEKRIDKNNMMSVSHDDMLMYAGGDTDACLRLSHKLMDEVRKDARNYNCFKYIQMPALKMFASTIETYGMEVDTEELYRLQNELQRKEEETYDELISMVPASIRKKHLDAGKELKFSRADFIRDILFSKEGYNLTPKVFTKSTQVLGKKDRIPSTSSKDHLPYFEDNIFVQKLIQYQKLQKMVSTYVGNRELNTGFWQYINDSKIHPSYNLHGTVTGRTSSRDPNGQNIPKRGDLAKSYRKIFVPPEGHVIVSADLSQAELRLVAWQANEKNMLEVYRSGGDIHANTAANIMGLTLDKFLQLPSSERSLARFRAKAVNFGFIYGMWWTKFMVYAKTDYGIDYTEEEAKLTRERFFSSYPALNKWHNDMKSFANKYGYVRSLHGALRRLPSIYSEDEGVRKSTERQAINSPIQRFASDLGIIAGARLVRDADPSIIRPVAFVHDQLVCVAKEEYADEAPAWIKFYMESVPYKRWFGIEPPLPILADAEISRFNLGESEELTDLKAAAPTWYKPELDNNKVTSTW